MTEWNLLLDKAAVAGIGATEFSKDSGRSALRLAVEADLRCVIGINPAMVAALPYQLAHWSPRIVKDLRDGTLGGRPYGAANRDRAAELERLAEYHGTLLPAHVWPNMELIFCWTTGLASLYLPRVRESFGSRVTVLPARRITPSFSTS